MNKNAQSIYDAAKARYDKVTKPKKVKFLSNLRDNIYTGELLKNTTDNTKEHRDFLIAAKEFYKNHPDEFYEGFQQLVKEKIDTFHARWSNNIKIFNAK